jgi:hypothetical protein
MLRNAYSEESLSGISGFEGLKRFEERLRKWKWKKKSSVKALLTAFLYAEIRFFMIFFILFIAFLQSTQDTCRKNRLWTVNFMKMWSRDWSLEFVQESGS